MLNRKFKSNPFGLIIIFLISLLPLLDLFQQGLPITHDGLDHIARIASFYNSLSDGIWIPRWAENLNWGYGHPVMMFLYPLSSYLASLFHFLGFSFVESYKLVFSVGFIGSGIAMYLWGREQFGEYFGIIVGAFYLLTPYRFIDLFVRGAIGEHMAFIFPPLVMYFLLLYFKNKKSTVSFLGIAISFCLLLLSHNAISLMFIPVFVVYVFYLSYVYKNTCKMVKVLLAFLWGILISAFFIFPAFLEGKFTLRDIVIGNEYKQRFVTNPLTFLYSPWNYGISGQFSPQLGIANIFGLMLLPLFFIKSKSGQSKIFFIIFIAILLISLFLMIPQSNFIYDAFPILKKFQFPWRFLTLSTFATSVIAGAVFLAIKKESLKKMLSIGLILLLIFTTFTYWKAKEYKDIPDKFFNGIYGGTTDTGESGPIWSVRFMEKKAPASIQVIEGNAEVESQFRNSVTHKYSVKVLSNQARIRENTLYFPGWRVIVDGKNHEIQFQDPTHRGIMTFELTKGLHKVELHFTDTKIRSLSNNISLFSFILLLGVGGFGVTKLLYGKNKNK